MERIDKIISYEEDGQSYFDDHRIYIDKKHQHNLIINTMARSYYLLISSPETLHQFFVPWNVGRLKDRRIINVRFLNNKYFTRLENRLEKDNLLKFQNNFVLLTFLVLY